ncbi:hypothetical protein CCACVL1_29728 [Corchorus capsularis]|uniref:Uncharacterized protein n=1 Tax=Corchorus capsularis TaxID=210143 RepID=A0A1R3G0D9_COCAP|nr:hypothetical protein CCACVL1_29728 [Corchorus capsularis]
MVSKSIFSFRRGCVMGYPFIEDEHAGDSLNLGQIANFTAPFQSCDTKPRTTYILPRSKLALVFNFKPCFVVRITN